MITYFVVQSFQKGKKGALIPDEPKQARNQHHCEMMAEKAAPSRAGVVAFSRSGDPDSGEWDDAVLIAQYGEVPNELLELAG